MAHTVVTRLGETHKKKLLSQMVLHVNEHNRDEFAAGDYLIGRLPAHCIVQEAYAFVKTAQGGAAAIDLGTTEAGTQIFANADINAAGEQGALAAKFDTGTGVDVFMNIDAVPAGEFVVVIEYLEYTCDTGSMTRF